MQMGGGIKIARVLTGQWVLLAARTDAAVQHPCRCFEKEILCATQKPQGGFPFLTAFDSNIILLNYRNYKEYKALQFPMLMSQL